MRFFPLLLMKQTRANKEQANADFPQQEKERKWRDARQGRNRETEANSGQKLYHFGSGLRDTD